MPPPLSASSIRQKTIASSRIITTAVSLFPTIVLCYSSDIDCRVDRYQTVVASVADRTAIVCKCVLPRPFDVFLYWLLRAHTIGLVDRRGQCENLITSEAGIFRKCFQLLHVGSLSLILEHVYRFFNTFET